MVEADMSLDLISTEIKKFLLSRIQQDMEQRVYINSELDSPCRRIL